MIHRLRRLFNLIAAVFAALASPWASPAARAQDANVREQPRKEKSSLLAAVDRDDLRGASDLLAGGADPNAISKTGTPLTRAIFRGNREMISLLLRHGADPRVPDTVARSPLQIAFERDAALGAWMLGQIKDATVLDAAEAGTLDDVRRLVDAGGDVNMTSRDERRLSPMHAAARRQDREMAAFLLDRGAAIKPPRGDSLLFDSNTSAAMTELLLRRGADPNATDSWGRTPLDVAALGYWADVMEVLIRGGADVNVRMPDGTTPLHSAAAHNPDPESRAIRILARHGARLNAQDRLGSTPLHAAIEHAHPDAAMTLLDLGADPTIRDQEGRTPVQLVRKSVELYPGMPEVVRRLDQASRPKR